MQFIACLANTFRGKNENTNTRTKVRRNYEIGNSPEHNRWKEQLQQILEGPAPDSETKGFTMNERIIEMARKAQEKW